MSLDGIMIRALTIELQELNGAKVDKIHQPDKFTVLLQLRAQGSTKKLLLSSHPINSRIHLTNNNYGNPPSPPNFCMVLRKHLENYRIKEIKQLAYERILHIDFEGLNEIGKKDEKRIILEIMGKHSNIILVNPQNNYIIDSIKHLGNNTSSYRNLLPGIQYISPPLQEKLNIDILDEELFIEKMLSFSIELPVEKCLLNTVLGVGPQTVEHIAAAAGIPKNTGVNTLGIKDYQSMFAAIVQIRHSLEEKKFSPVSIAENKVLFSCFYLAQFPREIQIEEESVNLLLETVIREKESSTKLEGLRNNFLQVIKKEIEKCEKKIGYQEQAVSFAEQAEELKKWGELIIANVYSIKQGKSAVLVDYYSEQAPEIVIPLNERLTPLENAQAFFKKYSKAKSGAMKAKELSNELMSELNYLHSIEMALEIAASVREIEEIREEMESSGYLKRKKIAVTNRKNNERNKKAEPELYQYRDSKIYVGKNNLQNDFLTFKLAQGHDYWLHVKNYPGAHVIIKNETGEADSETIAYAANLAVLFSKARFSGNVQVDYTLRKNVKKPGGSRAGFVIYEKEKSVFITPDEGLLKTK